MKSYIQFLFGFGLFALSIYFGRLQPVLDRHLACEGEAQVAAISLPLDVYTYFSENARMQVAEDNFMMFANVQMQFYWAQQQALMGYGLPSVSLKSLSQPITVGKFLPGRDQPLSQSHFWGSFTADSATAAVMANRAAPNGLAMVNKSPIQNPQIVPPPVSTKLVVPTNMSTVL